MALADKYDGFLVDLDGVVWVGGEVVDGAVEALNSLSGAGKPLVFVTNNPAQPPAAYEERLREAGVEADEGSVLTAGEVTARLAAEAAGPGGGAFAIGAPGFLELVASTGLEILEGEAGREADVVLVSGHRGFDYEELLTATFALRGGAALFATSRDPTLPMPGGVWPGTGAILAAVETASGRTAEIGGKPQRHLFEAARERLGNTGRTAMVGDRIASDVEGGRRAGLDTILVLTGACTREEADAADPPPDHVLESIAELV